MESPQVGATGVKDFLRDLILRAEDVLGKMIYKLTVTDIAIGETVAMINSVFAFVNQWEGNLQDISMEMLNVPATSKKEKTPTTCTAAEDRKIMEQVSQLVCKDEGNGGIQSESMPENGEEAQPVFVYLEQSLKQYKPGQTGTGYLTYVVPNTTTFFMIDRSSQIDGKLEQMLTSLQNVTTRLEELPNSDSVVFGVELEGTIFRAVRSKSALGWPFLKLLDVGEVVPYSESLMLYQLTKYYQQSAPLAIRCQLLDVVDEPFCGDFHRYLEENVYNIRRFEICESTYDILRVNLSTAVKETNPFRMLPQKKPVEPPPKEYKISEKTLTQEQLDSLYEEPLNTTNAMKATLGYVPKDDARICPFYDPTIQGCFKGASCRLEHVAKDPDGWTRDKALHKAKIRAQLVDPKIGSMVKLIPTAIVSVEEFYGQLDQKQSIEGLSELQRLLNDPTYIRDFRMMDHKPYTRELVFAYFAGDGHWYRAEVLEYFHDGLIDVFYVDYGNRENVRLEDLRMWDDRFDFLPFQAIHCRLANVSRLQENDERARAALQEEIQDRLVLVQVLDIRSYWEVLVYGAEMMDIGQLMVRRNMARARQPIVVSEKNGMVPA